MIRNIIALLVIGVLILGCNSDKKNTIEQEASKPDNGSNTNLPPDISQDVMDDFTENIANPVEMAALLIDLEVEFSPRYLASTHDVDELATPYQQAFHLGIYTADLGYLNMYNKTNSVMEYLNAIRTLAEKVRVIQFFDFTTMKRLSQNNQNLDSLMYISVHSFNQMDQYLRDDKRSELSTLMILGVWVESMYLITQVAKTLQEEGNLPQSLKDRIGEQKIILEKLLIILDNYKEYPSFTRLGQEISSLKEDFDAIDIKYTDGEPIPKVIDGVLTIEQTQQSIVTFSNDETLNNIIEKTEIIRTNLTRI